MFKRSIHAFIYAVLLFLSISYSINSFATSSYPKAIQLVEVSALEKGTLTISWLPTSDDNTLPENLIYRVYLSEKANFLPDNSSLKFRKKAATSAVIKNLKTAFSYFVLVTATDRNGNVSWSNMLEGKTTAFNPKRTAVVVHELTAQQTTKSMQAFKAGDYVVSRENGGSLRKIEPQLRGKQTAPSHASLNELFSELSFNTTVKFQDVPESSSTQQKQKSPQARSISWQETGLTLTDSDLSTNTNRTPKSLTLSGNMQTESGSYGEVKAPAYASAEPGVPFSLVANIAAVYDKNTFSGYQHIEFCKTKWSFTHKKSTLNDLLASNKPTTSSSRNKVNTDFYNQGVFSLNWNPTDQYVDMAGLPYIATVEVYYDAVGENCNGDDTFGTWEEVLTVDIPVYVTKGAPNEVAKEKPLSFSGGFNVTDKVSYNFKPELFIGATISGGSLKSADLKAVADLSVTNKLTITANGAATLKQRVAVLPQRKFIKVFAAGGVPIVVSGTFQVDALIEGNVTGKANLEKQLQLSFPNTTFGLEYRNGVWQEVKSFTPAYKFHITGDADANADLTLTLIPDLQVNFYDAASGRLIVEPYLYAQAGLHGQFRYLDTNGAVLNDLGYWFTDLQAGAGANLKLYAGLHIFDYNIASYPKNVTVNQVAQFKKVVIFDKTPFVKLPTLTAKLEINPVNAPLSDSRVMRVTGTTSNYVAPIIGKSLINFQQWTMPQIISAVKSAKLTPVTQVSDGNYWFNYKAAGTYTVRLLGYSDLGWFVQQMVEQEIVLTDTDNDGMVDQWESRYGVSDPAADDDHDGVTNLAEFKSGTFPNDVEIDTDKDGMPDYWEIRYGLNPNDATDAAKDKDGDGVSNLAEFKKGTNPLVKNTVITGKLNDTGIATCSNASQNGLPCPVAGFPGQDGEYGRDKTLNNDADGHAGFNFTKISSTGAALAASATSWNCVKDNVTGLMWENKTNDSGLHHSGWTYSWYEPDNTKNGGFAGYQNVGSCGGTSQCDTNAYVKAVNAAGWCGFKDWRMPSKEELYSIVDYSRYNPAIDAAYFPNTPNSWAWSSSPDAYDSYGAWIVDFSSGYGNYDGKSGSYFVRLVRGGQ